jgi:hypothetical protein
MNAWLLYIVDQKRGAQAERLQVGAEGGVRESFFPTWTGLRALVDDHADALSTCGLDEDVDASRQ